MFLISICLTFSHLRLTVNIENIKELRLGSMAHSEIARLVPEGLNNADTVNRWLTIIYTIEDEYKTLNLLAPSAELLTAWHDTVAALRRLRLDFMSGIVADSSGALWDRHHWKGADESGDNKLDYGEVEHLCRRLNFGGSKSELKKRLKEVDKGGKGYLTFDEFKIFVKELKRSPEVTKIYDEARQGSPFSFAVFDTFMRNTQKVCLSISLIGISSTAIHII
jgi:phosphatidylinositol phospholipase C delta